VVFDNDVLVNEVIWYLFILVKVNDGAYSEIMMVYTTDIRNRKKLVQM
jgi:hypothetical protein